MRKVLQSEIRKETENLVMAYNRVFEKNSPFVQDVLADLAKFCRANESTFHADPRIHAVLEGRRETFLRIQRFVTMNAEDILNLQTIK